MKRRLTILLIFLLAGLSVKAQDRQIFNHMSLGISLGADGVGADLALPITPYVQLRGGYAIFPYTFVSSIALNVQYEEVYLSTEPLNFTFWKGGNGKLLLDFYPTKTTPFRLTAGVFAGPGKAVSWDLDMGKLFTGTREAPCEFTKEGTTFSTNASGYILADAQLKQWIPYVGLGFGRAVNPDSRVTFNVDLGVLIQGTGGLQVQTYNFMNSSAGVAVLLESKHFRMSDGRQLDQGWVDKVAGFPVLPMLRFSVFFRLF